GAASWTGEYLNVFRNLQPLARGFSEYALQALLLPQHLAPAVAGSRESLRRVRDREIERVCAGKLFPGQRHGHGGTGRAARRIRDVERLAADVHVVVHEDLA